MAKPNGLLIVRLNEPFEFNMAGDVCGFEPKIANSLVNLGKAEFYDPAATAAAEDFGKMELSELRDRAKAMGIDISKVAARIDAKDTGKLKATLAEMLQGAVDAKKDPEK